MGPAGARAFGAPKPPMGAAAGLTNVAYSECVDYAERLTHPSMG
jgi:hypothetical protein